MRADMSPDTTRLLVSILIGAVFILFGVLGNKNMVWAVVTDMVLYAIDTLILLGIADYLGVVFHIFVLVMLYGGLQAVMSLSKTRTAVA